MGIPLTKMQALQLYKLTALQLIKDHFSVFVNRVFDNMFHLPQAKNVIEFAYFFVPKVNNFILRNNIDFVLPTTTTHKSL